jgi:hypothetical protein
VKFEGVYDDELTDAPLEDDVMVDDDGDENR